MFVACLWSRWSAAGEPDLLSLAAITDEPPTEIAAAGHDPCIIPIKRENLEAWLDPDAANLAAQYAILDDRARPYYEHQLAACGLNGTRRTQRRQPRKSWQAVMPSL
jgi:putative SOS response-associated peptidase YedK